MTRFYLREPDNLLVPTVSESSLLPWGTDATGTYEVCGLSTTKGNGVLESVSLSSLAQTARQSGLLGIFVSPPLAAQSISAQTWTFFYGAESGNTRANPFLTYDIYIYRPSTQTVIGSLESSNNVVNGEWSTSGGTLSGTRSLMASTSFAEGDVLVFEAWVTATQDKGNSYTNTLIWNGTDDTTTGTGNSSPASYIECPNTITFADVAPTARTLTASSASSTSVLLSWNEDTAAYPAPTYSVEQSTDNVSFSTVASGLSGTSYTVTGLTTNTLYYFRVVGTNSAGSATSNTASATPVVWELENTLEGGTDETSISSSPSLSGPDAFNLFYSNTPAVYDTVRAKGGTVSMRTEHTGTTGSSMAGWDFFPIISPGFILPFYTRFYLYVPSLPGSNTNIVRIGDGADGVITNIVLNSNGTLSIGSTVTTTASISTSEWIRIEAAITSTAAILRLYNTTESSTVTEEVTHSATYSEEVGTIRYGVNVVTDAGPFWWDSLKVGEDWIGPESAVPASPLTVYGGGVLSVAGGGILSVKTSTGVVQVYP